MSPRPDRVFRVNPVADTMSRLIVAVAHRVKSLYELKRTGGRCALATMCVGGGQGVAAIFERV